MRLSQTLYAQYIKDRENAEIIENESAFITFKIIKKEMIILNLFVDPVCRESGVARDLVSRLHSKAIENGCTLMTGNIYLDDPGANLTMQAALKTGFKIASANQNIIIIYKNIEIHSYNEVR